MRERTPSADDTPKRAPPAPAREVTPVDVAGSKTTNDTLESLPPTLAAGVEAVSTTCSAVPSTESSVPCSSTDRMVASTHNLEDLTVSHPASASSDRQQQQHAHTYRSGQTAQDKRSRLSNVINNLRKKVPDTKSADSPRKEEDDRNSVERNLETLEKYVMTVLNGVIKEEEDRETGGKKEDGSLENSREKVIEDQEDEDSKGPTARFEPSKPNESRSEVAILPIEEADGSKEHVLLRGCQLDEEDPGNGCTRESLREKTISKDNKASSKDATEDCWNLELPKIQSHDEEKRENRSLGTLIMDRLSDHQQEERVSVENAKNSTDNVELRNICRELLNDLLNGINQLIDEKVEGTSNDNRLPENSEELRKDFGKTSLHCSLPLDKVASVLQNCQSNDSPTSSQALTKSPSKPPSPTVRHLCLYCDRKFLSISLRQRHTERVHQLGGGRRSERNSRKPSQNCQYCSDKCAESLEGLFQHMAGTHGDKYYACVQCATRYPTREALTCHLTENHNSGQDKAKDSELGREKADKRVEEIEHRAAESSLLKVLISPGKDTPSNPGSPEFDSSFYSSVSCNIRENLLHHLDGKLQTTSASLGSPSVETKAQVQQTFYEQAVTQIQFPIDISLTAATPVYSKDYNAEEYENSSEYAQKPGKSSRSHPRRISFEKYNFPRKYDGREQWTCSIKDLSKFDISTQLSLRKKQQLLKDRLGLSISNQALDTPSDQTSLENRSTEEPLKDTVIANKSEDDENVRNDNLVSSGVAEAKSERTENSDSESATEFSAEFRHFLRLRKWDESKNEAAKAQKVEYAELTGEWSRPRIYICGACTTKHVTLREMEEHKAVSHPNVWCSHFEFSGDQRELYKHLFLPGRSTATAKARNAVLPEKVCTKCMKNCNSLAELHRHMLECGGDQAWLLGLFGNGKKKCKWRPFGSRSRKRRQRGMKRNIQNSQTPRNNVAREKQPTGPRVRPSDRESIQKMLANLPAKRATRKVLQDSTLRAQGRLRNVQTRSRPRLIDNSSASRLSRNKAALRNKLLKNAKSIQRNRCRSDNISAVIESVVKSYNSVDRIQEQRESTEDGDRETKDNGRSGGNLQTETEEAVKARGVRGPKKKAMKIGDNTGSDQTGARERIIGFKAKNRSSLKNTFKTNSDGDVSKKVKTLAKGKEGESESGKSASAAGKHRSPSTGPLKKKRPVDPIASLNASLKAKSQLRTQDGKFARNPNKNGSQKTPEGKGSRPVGRPSKNSANSRDSSATRPKLRAVHRSKSSDSIVPKRSTRLSSDSDKMPTLEPEIRISSEEYPEPATHDLPILSPVTSCTSDQKTRGGFKNAATSSNSEKSNSQRIVPERATIGAEATSEIKSGPPERGSTEKRRGRPRSDAKQAAKKELETENNREEVRTHKSRGRKSLVSKQANLSEHANEETKISKESKVDTSPRKDSAKKDDAKIDTRNTPKAKVVDIVEEPINIDTVPFEVKKLIGSANKEDLFTKLNLSRDGMSKRNLRHSIPRSNFIPSKGRLPKEQDSEKLNSSNEDLRKRRQSVDLRRKSPRTTEKKTPGEQPNLEESATSREVELKVGTRSRRTSCLSTEAKNISPDRCASSENIQAEKESENKSDETPFLEKENNKRQTRASLQSSGDTAALNQEPSIETTEITLKKSVSLEKRRETRRSAFDTAIDTSIDNENADKTIEEPLEDVPTEDNAATKTNVSEIDEKQTPVDIAVPEAEQTVPLKQSEESNIHAESNLNQLQLETSNSLDSGKENSVESSAQLQKQRGRPKKSLSVKRERTSKRSLNNVIGILTEGMNIPVETQQSVILTVQTSNMDNANIEGQLSFSSEQTDETSINETKTMNVEEKGREDNPTDISSSSSQETSCVSELKDGALNAENEPVALESKDQKMDVVSTEEKNAASPASDILLDLSRRKPSGKGSFLEKIVSKIAKQKDALLEGEVGSLLDTAADELSSILDEAGPALPDSGDTSLNESKIEMSDLDDSIKESDDRSVAIEEVLPSGEDFPKALEKVNEGFNLAKEDSIRQVDISHSKEMIDISFDADGNIDESVKDFETKLPIEVNDKDQVLDRIEDTLIINEMPSIPNGICLSIMAPEVKDSSQVSSEEVLDEKSRSNAMKRSLESNSPKKNKRKSVEPVDPLEEGLLAEEINLADIMSLIQKSNQVPSDSKDDGEKIQLGKRKSLEDMDYSNTFSEEDRYHKVEEDGPKTETITLECPKKLKVDADNDSAEQKSLNEEISKEMKIPNVANEVTSEKEMEDRTSSKVLRTGKRKSYVETTEEYTTDRESMYTHLSKRRSLPESGVRSDEEVVNSRNELDSVETSLILNFHNSLTSNNDGRENTLYSINPPVIEPVTTDNKCSEQALYVPQKTILRVPEISKLFENSFYKSNEPQETLTVPFPRSSINSNLSESKNVVNIVVPKIPKKRGRKKKSQGNEETLTPINTIENQIKPTDLLESQDIAPNKKSMRLNPLVELEDLIKNPDNVSPATEEEFKVPEVTEVLQHTRKRSSKRKSLLEEQSDEQTNLTSATEDAINSSVQSDHLLEEKASENDLADEKPTEDVSDKNQDTAEKLPETSSAFVDLVVPTGFCKKPESLPESVTEDRVNEDAESLASCTSEASQPRKKRVSKKKKSVEETLESTQDTSTTDTESVDTDRSSERRQSLTRKAKRNISFLYEDSDLVYDFEARLDFSNFEKALQNETKGEEPKLSTPEANAIPQEESVQKESVEVPTTDVPVNENEDLNASTMTSEPSAQESQVEDGQQKEEDFQTPKKRGAGNFVVVHTKTGEILIVEKRKKLTKEAAKFFCDVCATSFTRKSSLKKHNLSQSHQLQLVKSSKEKGLSLFNGKSLESVEDIKDTSWTSEPAISDISVEEENKVASEDPIDTNPVADIVSESLTSNCEDNSNRLEETSMTMESPNPYQFPIQTNALIDSRATIPESLEDELLDEEICKITENMSHDEYVLTDHVSPLQPETTSTPIKAVVEEIEVPKKRKAERKREKSKKKNLAEEHLTLDTPEPKELSDTETLSHSIEAANFDSSMHLSILQTIPLEEAPKEVTNDLRVSEDTSEKSKETCEAQRGEKERKRCLELEVSDSQSPSKLKKDQSIKEVLEESTDKGIAKEESRVFNDRACLKITISKKSFESSSCAFEINSVKSNDTQFSANHSMEQVPEKAETFDNAASNSVMDVSSLEPQVDQNMEETSSCEQAKKQDANLEMDQSKGQKTKKGKSKKHSADRVARESKIEIEATKKSAKSKRSKRSSGQNSAVSDGKEDECPEINKDPNSSTSNEEKLETSNTTEETSKSNEEPTELQPNKTELSSTHVNSVEVVSLPLNEDAKDLDESGSPAEEASDKIESKQSLFSIDVEDNFSNSSFIGKPLAEFLSHIEDGKDKCESEEDKNDFRISSPVEKFEEKDVSNKNVSLDIENDQSLGILKASTGLISSLEEEAVSKEDEQPIPEPQIEQNGNGNSTKPEKTLSDSETSENESFPDKSSPANVKTDSVKSFEDTAEETESNRKVESTDTPVRRFDGIDNQSVNETAAKVHKNSKRKSKGSKSKSRRSSTKSKFLNITSESEESDSEDKNNSQNKGKIVKSVFGRVFGGEKTDKVKEVLNDWVSKSEDDSEASRIGLESSDKANNLKSKEEESEKRQSEGSSAKKRGRKSKNKASEEEAKKDKSPENIGNRKKQETINNHLSSPLEFEDSAVSKCRQSKKRAEERISREIYFESLISTDTLDLEKPLKDFKSTAHESKNSKVTQASKTKSASNYDNLPEDAHLEEQTESEAERLNRRRKSLGSKKNRKKNREEDVRTPKCITNGTSNDVSPTLRREEANPSEKKVRKEKKASIDLESNTSSSLAISTPRDRSPSLDRNSQTTRDSDETEENLERCRMSPLFARSTPDSSMDSSSNSENEEEKRNRSCSEFSGEKIVIRSPSHKSEVVTIAPTDAIEDNALDVPQDIEASKQRQGKVLNFDEELFVECCSRLKATTENELRGAKKIKLDHPEGYHRNEEQDPAFKHSKDRWRDVESQNSLGSLLESVNQLLGEEMYTREREYPKRGSRSDPSSRSGSPDISRSENLGYEDSLDVAFEHNNKLRDKIQQRMRESENLIASTFGQKSNEHAVPREHRKNDTQHNVRHPYDHVRDLPNGRTHDHPGRKIHLDPPDFKSEMNLGGLLDKALSNLLHSNGKHDQNGSTPMKVLAELACAQAPTSLNEGDHQDQIASPVINSARPEKDTIQNSGLSMDKDQHVKKARNPIKELFERKKINERKQEKSKSDAALKELNAQKQRKTKKPKRSQEFPLIRRGDHGGLVERKKRRDGTDRKDDAGCDRIKDVYDFDEEESQMEPTLGTVMSYRSRTDKSYEVSCVRTKDVDVAGLMSRAIGETLSNGKTSDALGTRLESMIDKKFKELEKFAPKTKGALKSFQSEDPPRPVTGPMDDFVERKQQKSKRTSDQGLKQSKLKKRNKSPKKKARNAWYENDSSDEYRTAVKAEEVGVGITKSQRTCSKGKQNLFAELSTSSDSELEDDEDDSAKQRDRKSATKKIHAGVEEENENPKEFHVPNDNQLDDWEDLHQQSGDKIDMDNKKSESELSDHPLIIDERKDTDEPRNSDDEPENHYDRGFELDDLYREDSSVADSDAEEPSYEVQSAIDDNTIKNPANPRDKTKISPEDDLIPLEEALDLLDPPENALDSKYESKETEQVSVAQSIEQEVDQTSNNIDEVEDKSLVEEQDEDADDDIPALPEKLTSNKKPQKESENLPLHVFLSRKVQESKKRKEQQLRKLQEEQERILMDYHPTRRQRKCAIGKQGLLAEISSSDDEIHTKESRRVGDKLDHDRARKQKRESKEKRKERYIEKKHEQMIAKEQKAIEEEILRELGKKKDNQSSEVKENLDHNNDQSGSDQTDDARDYTQAQKKKHPAKKKSSDASLKSDDALSDIENNCDDAQSGMTSDNILESNPESPSKQKKHSKSPSKLKRTGKPESKTPVSMKKSKTPTERTKSRTSSSTGKDNKERRSSNGKRDSDDEELKTTKSWNKVEEGVGVAIGRRKRAAANQLYYWSSSSDEDEMIEVAPVIEEEEDDRQEQHGWIVGDSHKRMITMLAMEKQLKEKRRRSEDELEPGKGKTKKHRNSTS